MGGAATGAGGVLLALDTCMDEEPALGEEEEELQPEPMQQLTPSRSRRRLKKARRRLIKDISKLCELVEDPVTRTPLGCVRITMRVPANAPFRGRTLHCFEVRISKKKATLGIAHSIPVIVPPLLATRPWYEKARDDPCNPRQEEREWQRTLKALERLGYAMTVECAVSSPGGHILTSFAGNRLCPTFGRKVLACRAYLMAV